jgi:hypothetical protein
LPGDRPWDKNDSARTGKSSLSFSLFKKKKKKKREQFTHKYITKKGKDIICIPFRRVHNFIIEYRVIQGQTQSDGMGRR